MNWNGALEKKTLERMWEWRIVGTAGSNKYFWRALRSSNWTNSSSGSLTKLPTQHSTNLILYLNHTAPRSQPNVQLTVSTTLTTTASQSGFLPPIHPNHPAQSNQSAQTNQTNLIISLLPPNIELLSPPNIQLCFIQLTSF